ncbi:MAG: serine/threonine-protein kinase [Nannocystaceae bacterium]
MAEPAPEPDLSGTVLERYRLLRLLGRGGMGSVYEAQHEMLDRRVAIKVLSARLAAHERARQRFLREARAASRVHHDNVIEIHDVGFAGGHVFFVMERLQGEDLAQRLQRCGSLSWAEARPLLLQVTAALAAAHEAGVVHRDVKPANCFVVDDGRGFERVKVLDFGIAKVASSVADPVTELTVTGEVFGTAGYLPPEISQGVSDDPRSDIYALGVMMFRVLTGRLPFEGTAVEVVAQHIGRAPPSLRSIEPSIPEAVERIVLAALAKEPEDRPASMQQLGRQLAAVGSSTEPQRAATSAPPPRSSARARDPRPAAPSISRAEVIDLDARAAAPRHDVVISPSRSVRRGWTTAYAEEPEPPPPPMPGQTEAVLELDLPTGWKPGQPTESTQRSSSSRGGRVPWRAVAGLAVVVALGAGAWGLRERLFGTVPTSVEQGLGLGHETEPEPEMEMEPEPEMVLLLVDTKPKGAKVFIDDVLRSERPVRLPRSEEHVRVRVEADGFQPRTIQVQPVTTRRLEVVLDRARTRR